MRVFNQDLVMETMSLSLPPQSRGGQPGPNLIRQHVIPLASQLHDSETLP